MSKSKQHGSDFQAPWALRWFAIEEDAWEAPFCILLTDDADEMGGTFVNLQVSVSVGLWLGPDWRHWRPRVRPNMTRFRIFRHGLCIYCGDPNVDHKVICISSLFSFVLSFFSTPSIGPYGSKYFPRRYLDAHRYTYFLDLRKTMVACMPLVFQKKTIHF